MHLFITSLRILHERSEAYNYTRDEKGLWSRDVISIHFDCDHNEKHSRRCLAVCCIRFTLNICVV
jgi:hypothetical protein